MNSKKLLIAFTAVSIAALIVSSFAVFAVARTYSASLAKAEAEPEAEDITPPEISVSVPAESEPCETSSSTAAEITETSASIETTVEVTLPETTTAEAAAFTLSLSGERLVILSPEGESVYERIIDVASLHPKDAEALLSGIEFPDFKGAMSAVYDLIS